VLIVPGLVVIFQRLFKKKKLGSWKTHFSGLAIMLAIGLSWFIYLQLEDDRFLNYFLFKHTIDRFATDTFNRGKPFWFYLAILLGTAFPWFINLLKKIPMFWKANKSKGALLLTWVFLPLLFFSISQSKLILYILPIFPGLAIGAIYFWGRIKVSQQKTWEKYQLVYHAILMLALLSLTLIDPGISLNYKYYFIWFIVASLLFAIQKVNIKTADRTVISAFIFTLGLTTMSTYFMIQNPGLINDTRHVTEWISTHEPETKEVFIYDKRLPSILFNTDLKVISIFDGDESLNRETQFQQDQAWKKQLINLKANPEWIETSAPNKSLWLMKSKKQLPQTDKGFDWQKLEEIDGWKIMRLLKH
jgi:4-amino-4-deoxy-L-arabinose transferase-like glycosyltransferase